MQIASQEKATRLAIDNEGRCAPRTLRLFSKASPRSLCDGAFCRTLERAIHAFANTPDGVLNRPDPSIRANESFQLARL
jgi:hypothetical protein